MELHRLVTVCDIVRSAADQHSADAQALARALHEQHVNAVELAEALDDVGLLPPESATEMEGLLRLVLERMSEAGITR